MRMTRLEKWSSSEWRADLITTGKKNSKALWDLAEASRVDDPDRKKPDGGPAHQLFKMAKEIVFDIDDDGQVVLSPVTWILDTDSYQYVLKDLIRGEYDDDDDVKRDLAWALAHEVPVVPNRDEVRLRLEELFADLIATGFKSASDGEGRLRITDKLKFDPEGETNFDRMVAQPAEVSELISRLNAEREQNSRAKSVLARLEAASIELRELLTATDRNEHALQRCLTKYPVLFGSAYSRMISKHRLGSDYELDYALELADGTIDLVEIEASTHKLYKRNGDPTVALVHAEQQVLDWLEWIDRNSPYAREKLPGIRRPSGLVVIGSRSDFRDGDESRLSWRNIMYAGRLTILTYDDLLDRCDALRRLLVST